MGASKMTDPLVIASGVGKEFPGGVQALTAVDLTIERGQFTAIVGPSGCGKSTSFEASRWIDEHTSGTLSVDGDALARGTPSTRRFGLRFSGCHAPTLAQRPTQRRVTTATPTAER